MFVYGLFHESILARLLCLGCELLNVCQSNGFQILPNIYNVKSRDIPGESLDVELWLTRITFRDAGD